MHPTPTPTADSATAMISVSAGTFLVGGQSITYAAAIGTVSVSPGVTHEVAHCLGWRHDNDKYNSMYCKD